MTDFTVTANIVSLSDIQTFGKFQKRTLHLETGDMYYSDYVFTLSGKHLHDADAFRPGDRVTVHFNIACRQSARDEAMWFTNLNPWKIEIAGDGEDDDLLPEKRKADAKRSGDDIFGYPDTPETTLETLPDPPF